jgi:hypothetical protein
MYSFTKIKWSIKKKAMCRKECKKEEIMLKEIKSCERRKGKNILSKITRKHKCK